VGHPGHLGAAAGKQGQGHGGNGDALGKVRHVCLLIAPSLYLFKGTKSSFLLCTLIPTLAQNRIEEKPPCLQMESMPRRRESLPYWPRRFMPRKEPPARRSR